LVRELRDIYRPAFKSIEVTEDVVDSVLVLVAKALVDGKKVFFGDLFGLELSPGRDGVEKVTPQGKKWRGATRPRLKATVYWGLKTALQERNPGGKRV